MSEDNITVEHNEPLSQFEINLEGVTAFLRYRMDGDNVVMFSTVSPVELRGKGIAGKLAKHALEKFKADGKKVVPQCSYIDAYIKKHAEYQDMVA